jgi:hypothetical protein
MKNGSPSLASTRLLARLSLACALALACARAPAADGLQASLSRAAPAVDPAVLGLALQAVNCASQADTARPQRLAVIDYSRASTEPRLWVFDLDRRRLLFSERVAHGRNSGDNYAVKFSNRESSLASSLGLFRTLDTYDGDNGYSLRMEGLEPGINSNAYDRAIVIHGADYVSDKFVRKVGRIGRSHGCPAVRRQVATPLIDSLKGGNYVFAYYPDAGWLKSSRFLHCDAAPQPLQTALSSDR